MKTSETIGHLAAALATAQAEYPGIDKNRHVKVQFKNGGGYEHDYATFDNILASVRPVLGKNGLAVLQGIETSETKDEKDGTIYIIVTVTTRIVHASGEWIEDSIWAVAESGEPQKIGSCTTYLKRYAYCSMLNIAADEDDDGNAASGNNATPSARNAVKKPASKPLTGGHAPPAVVGKEPAPVDPPETKAQESAFQAAVGKIAMTFTHPELDKLTQRLVDSVKLDEKEKTALLGMIKGQRLKADEAEKQANANTAA